MSAEETALCGLRGSTRMIRPGRLATGSPAASLSCQPKCSAKPTPGLQGENLVNLRAPRTAKNQSQFGCEMGPRCDSPTPCKCHVATSHRTALGSCLSVGH